jgi:hypothetical protein
MIKQSTTSGSNFVDALVTPNVSPIVPNINGVGCSSNGCVSPLPPVTPAVGNGVHMQYNSTSDVGTTALTGYSFPNEWLKLQRLGDTFTSWYSTDGVTWTQIGSVNVTMTNPVTIGLFVTSHNVVETSTVAFDSVSFIPGP